MIAANSSNGRQIESPPVAVGENIANLAQDILTLAELQVRLFLVDLQAARVSALIPAIVFVSGTCLLLGTTPVLLLAAAVALSDGFNLTIALSGLIVSGLSLCLSISGMWLAATRLMQATQPLLRSKDEFQENLSWIKNVIRQSTMSNRT